MINTQQPVRWGLIDTPFGSFAVWVDQDGRITRFLLDAARASDVDPHALRDDRAIDRVRMQVREYCAGARQSFDVELAACGTPFQHAVWDALLRIPFGETRSYGQIAREIGRPASARAVGAANGDNPIALIVPCHRVIGADGSLTGYGGGLPLKRALLEHEARYAPRAADLFATG